MPKLHSSTKYRIMMLFALGAAVSGLIFKSSPFWLNIAIIICVGLSFSLQVQITEGKLEQALLDIQIAGLKRGAKNGSDLGNQLPSKLFRVFTPKLMLIVVADDIAAARKEAEVFLKGHRKTREAFNAFGDTNLLATDAEPITEIENLPSDKEVFISYEFVEFPLYPYQWHMLVHHFDLPPVIYVKGGGVSIKEALGEEVEA